MWSEAALKGRLKARAAELGKPLRQLLAEAGVGHDTIDKVPAAGRRIDTLEKLARACEWSLEEIMGFSMLGRISLELSQMAFTTAERVLARLPREAQTRERLIAFHAYIYDALSACRREGRPLDAATLTAYEQILIHAWEGVGPRSAGPAAEP